MDYTYLLKRAWTIVWTHKFLIFLGVLAALGSGNGNNITWRANGNDGNGTPTFDFVEGTWAGIPLVLIILLIAVALVIVFALWVIATVARGGLIAAVDAIERDAQVTFVTAWTTGWQKVWPLLGIALLPAIPVLVLLVAGLMMTGILAAFATLVGVNLDLSFGAGIGAFVIALACVAAPIALLLVLLRNFAERACVLEGAGVLAAYRRGWEVLARNLGPAIALFLIQIGLTIALMIGMIGPGIVMLLCFLLWPLLLLIGGTVAAYFSTLWTLAWREWTMQNTSASTIAAVTPGQ